MSNPLIHVTDYSKGLSKSIDRMNRQLQDSTKLMEEQSRQQYEAQTAVTPVKVLLGISEAVNAGAKAYSAYDTATEKKVNQDLKGLNLSDEDIKTYLTDKAELGDDYNAYTQLLKGLRARGKHEAAKYLEGLHGRKLHHAKSYLAGRISATLPSMWNHAKQNNAKINNEFINLETKDQKLSYIRNWAGEQFGDEFLNKGLLFENAADNLNTWFEQEDIESTTAITKMIGTEKENAHIQNLENACVNQGSNEELCAQNLKQDFDETVADVEGSGAITQAGNGIEVDGIPVQNIEWKDVSKLNEKELKSYHRSIARELTTQRYIKLAERDLLSDNLLARLRKAKIDYGGGNSLENVFTKDQWSRIEQAASEGSHKAAILQIKNRDQFLENASNELQVQWEQGNITAKKFSAEIDILEAKGLDNKTVSLLRQLSKGDFSETTYNQAISENSKHARTGYKNLSEDEIDAIPNINARIEIQNEKADYDKFYDSIEGDNILDSIVSTMDLDFPTIPGGQIQTKGNEGFVLTDMQNEAYKLIAEAKANDLKGRAATQWVKTALKQHWLDHDGGQVNDHTTKFKGKYATNHAGEYSNWDTYQNNLVDIETEAKTQITPTLANTWLNQTNKHINRFKGTDAEKRNQAIDTFNDKFISVGDLVGVTQTGVFSDELKAKAHKLNIPVYALFERQLASLLSNKKYEDVVATYDLQDYELPQEISNLFDGFKALPYDIQLDANRLLSQDPLSWSYNQIQRLQLYATSGLDEDVVNELLKVIQANREKANKQ